MNRITIILFVVWLAVNVHAETTPAGDIPGESSFILPDMDGASHNVDDILQHGQNVTLIFWQTWCKVCIREAPELVKSYQVHQDAIRFFGIISGTDADVDDQKVRRMTKKLELSWPQIRDRDLSITRRYGVTGTPTIIVLGPNRAVLYRDHRLPADWQPYRRNEVVD